LPILSDIVGWSYVIVWGLFAYPQIYLNYKLQSVEGFKLDYPFLNLSGFIFYSMAFSAGFFIQGLPFQNYGLGTIRIQDLVFALHGIFINIIFNLQACFYKRGKNTISKFTIYFAIACWAAAIFAFLATTVFDWIPISAGFNILEFLGDLKVAITCVKYAPLVYWNWIRKSTEGFSILSFILDFSGGVLSITQEMIDLGDGTTATLNPAKMGLGIVCIIYDSILMFQHFALYGGKKAKANNESLLTSHASALEGGEEDEKKYLKL